MRELEGGNRKAETCPVRDNCLVQVNNEVDICVMASARAMMSSSNVPRDSGMGREIGKGNLCGRKA